mmetsp:Transcript_2155/g.5423  ORF Transcript_2155/g.5423 Transcript_2155/m.5423 type:complete len:153 (+) Transcript_2155:3097-3555(+)
MELKLLAAKLTSQALTSLVFSFLQQTPAFIALYTVLFAAFELWLGLGRNFRTSLKEVGRAWLLVVLFGGGVFDVETSCLVMVLGLYVSLPYSTTQVLSAAEKGALIGAFIAATQVPLDWDFESLWQVYPVPMLLCIDWGHTVGLVLAALNLA